MSGRNTKALLAGAPAALLALSASPAHATHYTFSIGVAANFATAVQQVISAFADYYAGLTGDTYTINVHSDSTGNLKTCILTPSTATNYTTNCPSGHYDLFLSADTTTPAAVSTQGMIVGGVTQAPFFYAIGSLDLYGQQTDISAGLPTTFTVPFVIADPSKAPYGFAAMTVLNTSPWSLGLNTTAPYPQSTTGPVSFVHTQPNIGATWGSVYNPAGSPTYAYGFVNKSAICQLDDNGNESYPTPPGGFHHEYVYNDPSHPYGQIVQNGLPIELGQSAALKTQVMNFVAYLGGSGDGGGLAVIQQFCYGTTAP
jgi:molybdate transport system substrate-binding protein